MQAGIESWQVPHLALLAADVVLFARDSEDDGTCNVLLIERRDEPFAECWALPGGLVDVDNGETFQAAARRELFEETGVVVPAGLSEVGTFSDPGRDPRRRVVSTAFTACLSDLAVPTAGDDAATAMWHPVGDVLTGAAPGSVSLAFDHAEIVQAAFRLLARDW